MATPSKSIRACLCIVFNHPYVEHIPLLREVYRGRFSEVRFLVPLKRMPDADVITVYRGSYSHNAYMTDALDALPKDCDRYLFVHDDVLLAPALDERNIDGVFGLQGGSDAFMPYLRGCPKDVSEWGHQLGALWRFLLPRNFLSGTGVESVQTALRELPPVAEALAKLQIYGGEMPTRFHVEAGSLDPSRDLGRFRYFPGRSDEDEAAFKAALVQNLFAPDKAGDGVLEAPYPLLVSGPSADFCIVGGDALADLAHYSGVLAAAGLFVEIAFPTALALAARQVATEGDVGVRFEWASRWLPFDEALDQMRAERALVAIHPVKLSMVSDKEAMLARLQEARGWDLPEPVSFISVQDRIAELAPGFDPELYLAANPDVRAARVSPHRHYLNHGRFEGRRLS